MQLPLAKKIKDLGFGLVLTDANFYAPARACSDFFVQKSTFDIDGNLEVIPEIDALFRIRAVLTVAADCHETVATIANQLGLPHTPIRISRICRNKSLTRELLQSVGLPQPRWGLTRNFLEAQKLAGELDCPFVVKATDNSGSRGFSSFSQKDEFAEKHFVQALAAGTTDTVIIEERLVPLGDGMPSEMSVETLWLGGVMLPLNAVDRLFRSDFELLTGTEYPFKNLGWGVEIGHINPSLRSLHFCQRVFLDVYRAGIAMGLGQEPGPHILKADVFVTESGPVILELTPRLSGGWDSSMTSILRGADFQLGYLELLLAEGDIGEVVERRFLFREVDLWAVTLSVPGETRQDNLGRSFFFGQGNDARDVLLQVKDKLVDGINVE